MPRVSIITPTKDRHPLLPAIWQCVSAQSFHDFEWLVHDGTATRATMFAEIDDPRVLYRHVPGEMTIGAKRNALCEASEGDVIVHFDDDDFYAPSYISEMLSFMAEQEADFVKLFGFFLYHRANNVLAYLNLESDFPLCFQLRGSDTDVPIACASRPDRLRPWGYGFCYVYSRKAWEDFAFDDRDWGEDHVFADKVIAKYKSAGRQDLTYSCLHVLHGTNISWTYPQQVMSADGLLTQLFPSFGL